MANLRQSVIPLRRINSLKELLAQKAKQFLVAISFKGASIQSAGTPTIRYENLIFKVTLLRASGALAKRARRTRR
jgi:hypothetical protein